MHNWNEQLFLWINGHAGHSFVLDTFFRFVAGPLVYILISFSLLLVFIISPFRATTPTKQLRALGDIGLYILSIVTTWVIIELLKGTVAFPRPVQILTGVHSLLLFGNNDSFPSLHTAVAFTIATLVYHYSNLLGIFCYFFAVLIGLGRIFVGLHFPLDVCVGAVIGILIPLFFIRTFRRDTLSICQ